MHTIGSGRNSIKSTLSHNVVSCLNNVVGRGKGVISRMPYSNWIHTGLILTVLPWIVLAALLFRQRLVAVRQNSGTIPVHYRQYVRVAGCEPPHSSGGYKHSRLTGRWCRLWVDERQSQRSAWLTACFNVVIHTARGGKAPQGVSVRLYSCPVYQPTRSTFFG